MTWYLLLIAFGLDLVLADPYTWPHPVKAMGHYIGAFEKWTKFQDQSPGKQKQLGWLLLFSLLGLSLGLTGLLLYLANQIHPLLGQVVTVYLFYASFSVRGLMKEASKVAAAYQTGGLEAGRKQVGMIVGRETQSLSLEEIVKATIETVAENTSDGFVAPLFYGLVFGPLGAIGYKAINTLDSMVGYQNTKYQHFGFASAKTDDLANLIPARISWCLMLLATALLGLDWKGAWRVGISDNRKHLSPNSGYPESVMAGALGLQLGGTHTYHGVEVYKPSIGQAKNTPKIDDIYKANRILLMTSILAVLFSCSIILLRRFL